MYQQELLNSHITEILRLFLRSDSKSLYFNQIGKLCDISSKNSLLKHLDTLVALDVLRKEEHINNTFYTLNKEGSVTPALLHLLAITDMHAAVREKWYIQSANATPLSIM